MATEDDILQEALERFDESQSATDTIRQWAEDDITFGRLGDQWPDDIKNQRERESRPCHTVNKMPTFIRQVVNEARQNKPAIVIHPVDNFADEDTAEVINGLVRSIERTSNADIAYDTAIDHAVSGGFGFFRVEIAFARPDSFAMECRIKRVPNPLMVHWDPNSMEFDASDWDYAFVSELVSEDAFKVMYPDAAPVSFEGSSTEDAVTKHWKVDEKIRLAEYWQREMVKHDLLLLRNRRGTITVREDMLPKQARASLEDAGIMVAEGISDDELVRLLMNDLGFEEINRRTVEAHEVRRRVISGAEVLSTEDWPGSMIPICPVWGDEVIIEGERHFRSMIRDARDPQIMFNYWRSATTELVALAPKAPWLLEEGSIPEGEDDKWDTANTRSHSYLMYARGTQLPQRQPFAGIPAGALQESLNANDDMKAVIGQKTFDPAMDMGNAQSSGVAIRRRRQESDISNFHFIDNLSRAIRYCGQVLVEIIPAVYSPQETIRILGEDETEEVIQLTQEAGGGEVVNGKRQLYNLSVGKYDVTVKAGPSYATQREETRETLLDIMRNVPDSAQFIGDVLLDHMDFQGADKISRRLSFLLPPEVRQAEAEEGMDDLPDEAKAIIQQGQALITELQARLQQAEQEAEESKALQASELAKAEADLMDARTKAKDQEQSHRLEVKEAAADAHFKERELDIKAVEVDAKLNESRARLLQAEIDASSAELGTDSAPLARRIMEMSDTVAGLVNAIIEQNKLTEARHAELLGVLASPKRIAVERDGDGRVIGGTSIVEQPTIN